jgi:hypothetical protein
MESRPSKRLIPRGFLAALACASVVTGVTGASATAAVVIYPDLPSLLSASGPLSMESFEQALPLNFAAHPPTDLGSFVVSSDGRFGIFTTGPTTGQRPTDGTHYLAFQARTLQLSFAQPITTLSLDFVDYGDLSTGYPVTLSMSTSAGDLVSIKEDGFLPNGNVFFFGFRSDVPLWDVTFHLSQGHLETVAVDAVRYSTVPELSSGNLLICGLLWLLGRRRGVHPATSS